MPVSLVYILRSGIAWSQIQASPPLLNIAKLLSKVAESVKNFYYYVIFCQPDIKLYLNIVLIFFVLSVDILCIFFTQISF